MLECLCTTVILWPFSLLTQGLAGSSIQQPLPPLPILCIFPFQLALSHVPFHHLAPCHPQLSLSSLIFHLKQHDLCCDRDINDITSTRKMPSENTRCSQVLYGVFPVEMASFRFLSQHRDMNAIFYLFYKISTVLLNFHNVIHVSVL